jgi:hypothetical protein
MAAESLGPYPLRVPDFVTMTTVHHAPPVHRANAIVERGVTFDFTVVLGRGTRDEADQLLSALVEVLGASLRTQDQVASHGNDFLHAVYDAEVHGRSITTEQFIAFPFGDLFHCAVNYERDDARAERVRTLLLSIANTAIVGHGP